VASATTVKSSTSSRLLALDWLRGIAVLVMVECHVFNAVLAPRYREAGWFVFLNWLNGFVAPAFLMVSGGVIGINLQKRWQDVLTFGKGWSRLWRRIGQIFIVAYLLHLPTPFLWQFFGPTGPHLIVLWTKMDILQCIAGSLSLILLLVPVVRNVRLHQLVCAVLGLIAAATLGLIAGWAKNSTLPGPLLSYLWPTGVGLFPLVPWAAFPLLGVWLGPAIFCAPPPVGAISNRDRSRLQTVPTMFQSSLRAALAGIAFLMVARFAPSNGWYDGVFIFSRLGWVLFGLAACCWLGEPVRGTRWLLEFGQLSLWSYTVHLILVYGSGLSFGMDALRTYKIPPFTEGFPPWAALICLAFVLSVTAWVVRWRAKSLQRKMK
jgi:uncharacterized membrane protein